VRLAVVETLLRQTRHATSVDCDVLASAWQVPPPAPAPDVDRHGEPPQALQQYVRGLTGHLIEHAQARPFIEQATALLAQAERQAPVLLPPLGGPEQQLLSAYAQHRLFGSPWLTAPAGMIAGWHLLFSTHVLAIWYAGLSMQMQRGLATRDALLASLWLLDQGLWRDEPLVHDVLRNLNASEYTSLELAVALASALAATPVRS
jgi:hypothetical protein